MWRGASPGVTLWAVRTKRELRQLIDDQATDELLTKFLLDVVTGAAEIIVEKPHRNGVEGMVERLVVKPDFSHKIRAAEMLMDRKHGKPESTVNVNEGSSTPSVDLNKIPYEEVLHILNVLEKADGTAPKTVNALPTGIIKKDSKP